jgi:hypothetical protein
MYAFTFKSSYSSYPTIDKTDRDDEASGRFAFDYAYAVYLASLWTTWKNYDVNERQQQEQHRALIGLSNTKGTGLTITEIGDFL